MSDDDREELVRLFLESPPEQVFEVLRSTMQELSEEKSDPPYNPFDRNDERTYRITAEDEKVLLRLGLRPRRRWFPWRRKWKE